MQIQNSSLNLAVWSGRMEPTTFTHPPAPVQMSQQQQGRASGKVAVITGGNSGLGFETAKALFLAGSHVVLCCRSVKAGEAVAHKILKSAEVQQDTHGSISVQELDLADLSSVSKAAQALLHLPFITHLVLNAGVMGLPFAKSKNGFEMQLGVNHVGHFYLTKLLLNKMAQQGSPARIISVASVGHKLAWALPLDDLNWQRRPYSPAGAYAQSKLCNVLFVRELARRLEEGGVSSVKVFAVHPGLIPSTGISNHTAAGWYSSIVKGLFSCCFAPLIKTPEQGAAAIAHAALAPELDPHSGAYLASCRVSLPSKLARDDELARALWEETERLLGAALAVGK